MEGPSTSGKGIHGLKAEDFRQQAEFRYHLRRFLRVSELNCREVGIEPSQFQLMLAVKGMPESLAPNITTLSKQLLIESHSVVELVDRLITKGLIERFRQGKDRRMVFLRLTPRGEELVQEVAVRNRQELVKDLPVFTQFLNTL